MCIAVIKKSLNPDYSYFVSFNRDERYTRPWKDIGFHWNTMPDVYGYLDIKTGGSWLVSNNKVIVFLVNKEMSIQKSLLSRSTVVIKIIQNANTAFEAISGLNNMCVSAIKPFALVTMDSENTFYFTNENYPINKMKNNFLRIEDELVLINRSFPNDFNETRIRENYYRFLNSPDPNPQKDDWQSWELILSDYCETNSQSNEKKMQLISEDWGTTSSIIIGVPRCKGSQNVIHKVVLKNHSKLKLLTI